MNTAPRIESSDLSIEQVYKDFYVVPDYQREYVWSEQDVLTFAEDIYDEFYGPKGDLIEEVEYFIGSTVVCRNADQVFELIDGQQRMTTIYLFLCAIRDFMKDRGIKPNQTLEGMIFSTRLGPDGEDVRDYRLALQYEDSRGVLTKIADVDFKVADIKPETSSIKCLLTAYKTLATFLQARFDEDPQSIRRFFMALVQRVKLIRIVTPNLSHALKVFETVNDRGVGLTAMDLLKNLMFMSTRPDEYPKLKELWKRLTVDLDECDEKHLRFLRYYVMASFADFRTHTGKPLREDEIYAWFQDHTEAAGLNKTPMAFAGGLAAAARDYRQFASGRSPSGKEIPYLDNIQSLSGKARQHFVLMLAARHLPDDAIEELAKHLECLFFVYVITREPTKNFESFFGDWAKDLRVAKDKKDIQEIVRKRIWPLMRQKSKEFDFAMGELTTDRLQRYRLKYVLGKLAQFVDQLAWQGAEATRNLRHYLDGKLEVEHILPRTPTAAQRGAFDMPEEYEAWAERFGNLSLLEKPLNASVQNASFAKKLDAYRQSKIVMTRAIESVEGFGQNNTLIAALTKLDSHTGWLSTDIRQRQERLVQLSRQVWLMDVAEQGA